MPEPKDVAGHEDPAAGVTMPTDPVGMLKTLVAADEVLVVAGHPGLLKQRLHVLPVRMNRS